MRRRNPQNPIVARMIEHIDILRPFLDRTTNPANPGWFQQRVWGYQPAHRDTYQATDFLLSLFRGIRKTSIDRCLLHAHRNLSLAVVRIMEGLVVRDPALCWTMLSMRRYDRFTYPAGGWGGMSATFRHSTVSAHLDVPLVIMKIWRYQRGSRSKIQDEVNAINRFIEALNLNEFATPLTSSHVGSSPLSPEEESSPSPSPASPSPASPGPPSPAIDEEQFECQCCFGECAFDNMVQCFEGHLFCKDCIGAYAQSAITGTGKPVLTCMAGECDVKFPRAQLEGALPAKTLDLLGEREQEESVRLATTVDDGDGDNGNGNEGVEEKVRKCPHCSYMVFLPAVHKVIQVRFIVMVLGIMLARCVPLLI